MSDDSKQWSKLLQAIAKGTVVPAIGHTEVAFWNCYETRRIYPTTHHE